MAHHPSHKKLIDAIIDGEVEAAEIAKRATELGDTLAKRLSLMSRAILAARVAGRISAPKAKEAYLLAYKVLSLGGFAQVAQAVADHSDKTANSISAEAKKLGTEVQKVQAIRKPDFLAREAEKRGNIAPVEEPS